MNAFSSSQFRYYSLVWMFHDHYLNNQIGKLQERTLGLLCKDTTSSFDELVEKGNTFTIHWRIFKNLVLNCKGKA